MMEMLERKVRLRAAQLYVERGQIEGQALEDWIRAESEVLESSILAPLWNKRQENEKRELTEALGREAVIGREAAPSLSRR
jgi:hypothetical protein